MCDRADVAALIRWWLGELAKVSGKRTGFQIEKLGPAIEKDFGVYISRTTLARHIRRCEPELAARTSYR